MELEQPIGDIVFYKGFLELFKKYGYKIIETDKNETPFILKYEDAPEDLENDVTRGLLVFDNIHEIKFYINLLERGIKNQLGDE